jgi:hypothetical protein
MEHPEIIPSDWIDVAGCACVVMRVYPKNSPFGVCKVVFNKIKPTTHDVDWNGEKWFSLSVLILEDTAETTIHMYDN